MPVIQTSSLPTAHCRLLVIRVGALGDTLMVTPLLRALRNRWPEAEIDMLVSGLAAPLLKFNPRLANLFILRRRNWPLALSLEKRRFELKRVKSGNILAAC